MEHKWTGLVLDNHDEVPLLDGVKRPCINLDNAATAPPLKRFFQKAQEFMRVYGVHEIDVPWPEHGASFTTLFEALAIDWMEEANLSAAGRSLGISCDATACINERGVGRGVERAGVICPKRIGVDQTSFQEGHKFLRVLSNQKSRNVLYAADNCQRGGLEGFCSGLSEEQRGEIESESMNMCAPYIAWTEEYVAGAGERISFDKSHVANHLDNAVEKVQRREHKAVVERGCDGLKGTRHVWLHNLRPQRYVDLKALRQHTLKTAEAWGVKDIVLSLLGYETRTWARKTWKQCLHWARLTDLGRVISVAQMPERHLEGILNTIVLKSTNVLGEEINSRIQRIKKMAADFATEDVFVSNPLSPGRPGPLPGLPQASMKTNAPHKTWKCHCSLFVVRRVAMLDSW